MMYLPSLDNARGVPLKQPICAICLDRTRGKTLERQLTHGVTIWLCEGHHSVAYTHRNDGRDFGVTLMCIWQSNGVFTRARARSLDAHLRAVRNVGHSARRGKPGSYAWPLLRQEAEHAFARGDDILTTIIRLREHHLRNHESVPSVRTMRRWAADCRWLRQPEQTTQRHLELVG